MKNLRTFIFILVSLFWLTDCCKKEEFSEYKVREVRNVGSLDCQITASYPGKSDIKYFGDCKTKIGSIVKVKLP